MPDCETCREKDVTIQALRAILEVACRELPCGCHPRLISLGQPARFVGGCDAPVMAFAAFVCTDCGVWFCSRACARLHFASHPPEISEPKAEEAHA